MYRERRFVFHFSKQTCHGGRLGKQCYDWRRTSFKLKWSESLKPHSSVQMYPFSVEKKTHYTKEHFIPSTVSFAVLTEGLFCQVTTCLFCVLCEWRGVSQTNSIQTHRGSSPFIFGFLFTLYDYIVIKQIVQSTALLLGRK